MKGIEELGVVALMLAGILLTPLLFILFDLWSGIRKAKQRKEKITSYGWRRTTQKIGQYYNALLALVVIDCMQMAGIWYLTNYYESRIPLFPLITLLGALGIALIEVKSIYEKADAKAKRHASDIALLAGEIAKHKSDPKELAAAVVDYMNKDLIKEDNK